MKKNYIIFMYIALHLIGAILYIHKQSYFLQQLFFKQKNERLLEELIHQKNSIIEQIYTTKNLQEIKQYAQEKLHMHQIKVTQINKVSLNDTKL